MARRLVAVTAICCRMTAAALLSFALPALAEDKPAEKPNRVERTAKKAADATERTARRAGKFVEKTATRAGKFVERTANKAGNAVKRALE
jgi:hypothetical protein